MPDMIEVVIDSIRVGLMSQQRVVILRVKTDERYLAIWIDPYMAEQITFSLQEVEVARPMSHDLMKNLLQSLDARVVRVEISSLSGEVFYGNIIVEQSGGHQQNIDSRPSDALALAVRSNVPIYISKEVLDEAGITPEEDISEDMLSGDPSSGGNLADSEIGEGTSKVEEDPSRLSIFQDFLDDIGPIAPEEGDEDKDD